MKNYPPTIILRHKKENLKKCSLRGLESNPEFVFFRYPEAILPDLSNYLLLSIDGQPLTKEDSNKGLFLLDGTWRYAEKMESFIDSKTVIEKRSLPKGGKTAYPRRQEDCSDPSAGLASVEALYIAYCVLGRNAERMLDLYHWKEKFLEINHDFLNSLKK